MRRSPPWRKSPRPLEDLVLLLEPLVLAPQPGQLGRLGLLPRQGLGGAGRQALVPPAPELVGVDPELSATCCRAFPLSSSRFTASALYSAVNRRRFLFSIVPSRAGGLHLTKVSTQPGQAH